MASADRVNLSIERAVQHANSLLNQHQNDNVMNYFLVR